MFTQLTHSFQEQKKSVRFDPDYQAILSRAVALGYTLPTLKCQIKQNAYLTSLKHLSIWNKLDVLYVFTNDGSKEFATLNWKNPSQFKCTLINNPTWSSSSGFTGNGSSSYLDTGWIPSSNGVNYTQNDASAFFYDHTNFAGASQQAFGAGTTSNVTQALRLNPRNGADQFTSQVNDSNSTADVLSVTDARGFHHIGRTVSGTRRYYKNGTSITTTAAATVGLPTNSVYILAMHLNAGASDYRASTVPVFGAGASLNGFEAKLYNAWITYNNIINSSSAYLNEYQAVLDRAIALSYSLPTEQEKIWQNQLIHDMKTLGLWTNLDVFYNFWVHDSDFATLNWKAPSTFQVTKHNNPTFKKNFGFTGDGGSMYLDTHWAPSGGTNFTQNSCGLFAYSPIQEQYDGVLVGCQDAGNTNSIYFSPRLALTGTSSGQLYYRLNDAVSMIATINPDAVGFYHIRRTASNARSAYKNGTSFNSDSEVSTGRSGKSVHILAQNNNGVVTSYSRHTISCLGLGGTFAGGEYGAYVAWNNYMAQTAQLDSDYDKVLDRAVELVYTLPSHTQQIKQSNLIKNLKVFDVWNSLDVLWIYANNGSSNFATLNWKSPTQYQNTLINSPTWTSNQGFAGNGSSSYLNTNFNAATNATKFTLNDASFFGHVNSNIALNSSSVFGALGAGGENTSINPRNGSDNAAAAINSVDSGAVTNTSSIGFFQVSRKVSTTLEIYKNGSSILSTAAVSTSIPSATMLVGAINNNGTPGNYTARQISCFGVGNALSGKESVLYSAWNTYLTSL